MTRAVRRWSEAALLAAVAFTMLWKGGKSLESTWLLAGLSAVLILAQAWFLRPAVAVPRRLWWPAMTLLVWTLLSYAHSHTRNYGFDEVLQAAGFTLVFCWAVREYAASATNAFPRRVARIIAAAAYVACAIGVAVYVFQPVNRFVGSFFDHRFDTDYWPNAWAELCLLAWPMVLWTLYSPEAGWKRDEFTPLRVALHWMVAAFFIGCLLLSYSRAGFLAFAGQVALCVPMLFAAYRRSIDWKHLVVGALSVMFFSMLWFSAINVLRSHYHPVESVLRKATFSSAEGGSSFSERAAFWKQAAALSTEHPLAGWGPYSFRFIQPRLQGDVLATSDHPHNVFLKYAVERGWPAALLLLALLVSVFFSAVPTWYAWARSRTDGAHVKLAMLIGVAGVLAHNLVDYNLQFVGILLPLALSLAFVAVPRAVRHAPRRAASQRVVECLLALLLLLFAGREGWYLLLSSQGRHAEASGNAAAALQEYRNAEPALFTRDLFLSEAGLSLDAGNLAEASAALDAYAKLNTEDARLWKLRGDVADLRKQPAEAIADYKKAYQLAKYDDIGIAHLLLRAMAAGKTKPTPEIDAWRPELERLMNDYALAVEQNTHFIALSRNVEGLVETAKLMAKLYPANADAYNGLIDTVQAKAAADRSTYTARQEGLLWNPK